MTRPAGGASSGGSAPPERAPVPETGQLQVAAVRYGTPHVRWLLFASILGSGVVGIDATVVNVALPAIGRDLGADLAALQWTVTAYTLTLASLMLLGGALGDRYGRRRVFRRRRRVVRSGFAALRGRAERRAADRGTGAPGRRRGASDTREPGDDPGVLRAG